MTLESVLGESCAVYDAPFSGLESMAVTGVTDQGLPYGAVICADPNDPSSAEKVHVFAGTITSQGFEATGTAVSWDASDAGAPDDLRQIDVSKFGIFEQYDDSVWRRSLSFGVGLTVGAREKMFQEPLDIGGTSHDSPISSRGLDDGGVAIRLFNPVSESIIQIDSPLGSGAIRYELPTLLPGGTANTFSRWGIDRDTESVVGALSNFPAFTEFGTYDLDTTTLLIGNSEPIAGGGSVSSFSPSVLDVAGGRVLGLDASTPQRLLTRDLAAIEDIQVEHTADSIQYADLWEPRAALGLPPGPRLAVGSVTSPNFSFAIEFSPLETAIQSGDVLDGKTVFFVEFGRGSRAGNLAVVLVHFDDFSRDWYLVGKPADEASQLPGIRGAWVLALCAALGIASIAGLTSRRPSARGTR